MEGKMNTTALPNRDCMNAIMTATSKRTMAAIQMVTVTTKYTNNLEHKHVYFRGIFLILVWCKFATFRYRKRLLIETLMFQNNNGYVPMMVNVIINRAMPTTMPWFSESETKWIAFGMDRTGGLTVYS